MEKERVNHYTKRLWNAKHTTEIRSILKEFEFECAGQKPSTSDSALHIDNVVGRSEQFYCYDSSKDGGYKPKCDGQCDYCRRICPKQ